jgi:uncharacterized protein YjbI with pentapeptide repeats
MAADGSAQPQGFRPRARVICHVIAVGVLANAVSPGVAHAAGPKNLPADAFAARVTAGAATFVGYRIRGDVDLTGAVVTHAVVCRNCTFDGSFRAPNARFAELVDLRGSEITGPVDLSSARFDGVFLAPAFDAAAELPLATFSELATFTDFGSADFSLARFQGDAVFANASATGSMVFRRTTFAGATDLSYFTFRGSAVFDGTTFKGPVDVSYAHFLGKASFDQVRADGDMTFRVARFYPGKIASFSAMKCAGDLDFAFAYFLREMAFNDLVVGGALSLPSVNGDGPLYFDQISARPFEMDVGTATAAVDPDNRRAVLSRIENSAKARGDIAVANDAHYANQVLKSEDYGTVHHLLDYVFYRTFAGYLVRPGNPLIVLLLLAAVMTVARALYGSGRFVAAAAAVRRLPGTFSRLVAQHSPRVNVQPLVTADGPDAAPDENRERSGSRSAGGKSRPRQARELARAAPSRANRVARETHDLVWSYIATLALIAPGSSRAEEKQARRLEVFVYRVLVACALVGLANSNPTLRDMLDAIH